MSSGPQSGPKKRKGGQEGSSAKKAKREEDEDPATYFTELYAKLPGELQRAKDAVRPGNKEEKMKAQNFLLRFRRTRTKLIAESITRVRDLKVKGQINNDTFRQLSETGENLYDLFTLNATPQKMLNEFNSAYCKTMTEEEERRKTVQKGPSSRKLGSFKTRLWDQIGLHKLRFEDIASGVYKKDVDETVKNGVIDALQKIKDYEAQKGHHNSRKSGQEEGDVDSEDGDGNPVDWNSSDDAEGDIEPGYYADKNGYPHREGSETEPM